MNEPEVPLGTRHRKNKQKTQKTEKMTNTYPTKKKQK
jgi:hypothetical protein